MNDIKEKVKAIIFDMDGTIIKTEHIWDKVTYEVLGKKGFASIPEGKKAVFNNLTGMGLRDAAKVLKEHFDFGETIEEIMSLKITLANVHFAQQLEFIEGFEDFHKKLQDHFIPSGIATNSHPDNLSKIVEVMKFEKYFGANIYSMAHVNFKAKPDPALFLHTAEMLGAKPGECIVFEDSIHGFNAAKAAGMKCIAVKNKKNEKLLDLVETAIESYHEAEEALRKISQ